MFEEGLFVPITKWYDAGRPNEELVKIIRANVREPDQVLGDIHAQVAGNDVGGARLKEFMAEFGLARIEPLADEIISALRAGDARRNRHRAGRRLHARARATASTRPCTLAVTITKQGDDIHVDWTGSARPARAASMSSSTTPMPT